MSRIVLPNSPGPRQEYVVPEFFAGRYLTSIEATMTTGLSLELAFLVVLQKSGQIVFTATSGTQFAAGIVVAIVFADFGAETFIAGARAQIPMPNILLEEGDIIRLESNAASFSDTLVVIE